MFEDTFETELTLQAKGDDLDQFLKTLEDDLVELRSEIAKFKYKRPKKGRSKRSPMSTVFDFAKLHDEIDGVESVIVAHSETNRMLHTRLRAEVGKPVKQIKDWLAGLKKIGAGVLPEELSVEISERLAPAVRERLAEARDTANQEHTVPHDLESDLLTLEKKRALGQLFDGIIVADLPAAERLKTAGGLDDTQAENVLKFYVYYAVFIEYFNSIKLLYQILLKEYEELDLIDDDVVTGLRTVAIFKITAFLCDHKWRGPGNAPRREQFRTGMLKAIRSKLMERAVAEKKATETSPRCRPSVCRAAASGARHFRWA